MIRSSLTWVISITTGKESSMMAGNPFTPSIIGHNCVFHWTEIYNQINPCYTGCCIEKVETVQIKVLTSCTMNRWLTDNCYNKYQQSLHVFYKRSYLCALKNTHMFCFCEIKTKVLTKQCWEYSIVSIVFTFQLLTTHRLREITGYNKRLLI